MGLLWDTEASFSFSLIGRYEDIPVIFGVFMNWLNRNHQAIIASATVLNVLLFGGAVYLSVVSTELTQESNNTTKEVIKKNDERELGAIFERVKQARTDIEKLNGLSKELDQKINVLDRKMAVIEEKLQNATTKSLMAAGATKKQALQFWDAPLKNSIQLPKFK